MTWQVFAALVLLAVTVCPLLARTWAKNPAARTRNLRIAVITGGLAILVIILGSTTVVSPRNVGVVTTFGRPSGTLSNGLHVKAPWQSVTEMNGTIQIDNHTGDNATTVRRYIRAAASRSTTSTWWRAI
jgi:SPFH domain / Band 7 family